MSSENRYKKLILWNKTGFFKSVIFIMGLSLFFISCDDKVEVNTGAGVSTGQQENFTLGGTSNDKTEVDKIEVNTGAGVNTGVQKNFTLGGSHNDK